ncbi:putative pentatricopeptide repeat-containing protein At5g40405 [Lolium perenne]|uniref:putative pentatricopeptide repeat-containing protein At5g40405 n=1 Tax=Lolium perenne TaxID=4522 RepID=UPI0021F5A780|nr:putative pentatricopeptide repeat-containing protein At5g40405 [Lolium perenne]XP_051191702.1 putative pentatricopeptide repeat-containing protein At5g40405 [Lolium perenne]XP_051191703.1 putative pentatricopeptide repeat-containing protein At5g40405 [Lolium perenne]
MSGAASPSTSPAPARPPAMRRLSRLRRAGGAIAAAAPGGFLHLSLLASLRRRPSLPAHAQLLLLGLPLPAHAASRLLRPHLRSGHHLASLRLFLRILRDRDREPPVDTETVPNSHSLSAALAACSRHATPAPGLSTHAFLIKSGHASDLFAANSLLHFYGSFGLPALARRLFDEMPVRDTVSFNTLIDSYVKSFCIDDAFAAFGMMLDRGFRLDRWTVTALSSACAGLMDLRVAKAVHGVARRALATKVFHSQEVVIGLVDMYLQCGGLALARKVFDLAGEKARDVRLWSMMVSGYARSGEVNMARKLFDETPKKDLVAWTALIGGYVQAGRYKEALLLFEEMEEAGFEADQVTVGTLVSACVQCGTIDVAKRLHHRVRRNGLISRDARLATCFVDMYAKHGCIQTAMDVFCGVGDELKTVELFNAMINGLAHGSFGEKAVALFDEMGSLELHPDKITFMAVLCACSRSGLVSRGIEIFDSMVDKYGVEQDIKHYACMSEILARDGRLDDAYRFIQNMPFEANKVVWSALLRACRIHGNIKIGKLAEGKLLQFDDHSRKPENILLSDLFADGKRKERAARVRKAINHKPEHRQPKRSYIEWNGKLHQFGTTTDTSHPQAKEISLILEEMSRKLCILGHNLSSKGETAYHSEMVALAFGLVNLVQDPQTPIKIVSKRRMDVSCHSSFKYLSKIYNRDICVNDGIRLHKMKQGSCSCMDHW